MAELEDITSGAVQGFWRSLVSTFSEWRSKRAKKRLLRSALLKTNHQWRSTEALQTAIASNRETAEALLLEIGARRSGDGQDLWTLKVSTKS